MQLINTQYITKPNGHTTDGSKIRLHSMFYTIQGEGPYGGNPAIFIRLEGCDLRCFWCDTDYSNGETLPIEVIRDMVKEMRANTPHNTIIVLTGGEPLAQNIVPLLHLLTPLVPIVQIETNGSVCPPNFPWHDKQIKVVVSPKTPILHSDFRISRNIAAWKYIINVDEPVSEEDGLPMYSTQFQGKYAELARPNEYATFEQIYISPLDNDKQKENMKEAARISMLHGYRVSLQTHKILGVE